MHALLTGDRQAEPLTPVTREEAAALSRGLLTLIDRHPWLGEHPLMLAYSRLLLAVPTDTNQVQSLRDRNEETWGAAVEQQHRNDELEKELQGVKIQLETEAARFLARETDLGLAQRQVQDYNRELAEAKAELTNVKAELGRVKAEAPDFKVQKSKLDRKVGELTELLRQQETRATNQAQTLSDLTVEKEKSARLQAKFNLCSTTFQELEWSAAHPTYTFSNSRKRVPCCPVCQGLSPNEVASHREAGHRKDCAFLKLRKLLLG
jgi:hypothetical protein